MKRRKLRRRDAFVPQGRIAADCDCLASQLPSPTKTLLSLVAGVDVMTPGEDEYPWLDRAIAVRRARVNEPMSAEAIAVGNLAAVVKMISALPPSKQRDVRISMPTRLERPIVFECKDIPALITALKKR